MTRDLLYPRLYGALGPFLGVGSFAFHGTLEAWGGAADLVSMYIAFFIACDAARIGAWRKGRFIAFGSPAAAPSAALGLIPPEHGEWVFADLVGGALVLEAAISVPRLRPWAPRTIDAARHPWFWAGLASFATAFGIWLISRRALVYPRVGVAGSRPLACAHRLRRLALLPVLPVRAGPACGPRRPCSAIRRHPVGLEPDTRRYR